MWPQPEHRSRWPPSAAVRQRVIASQHLLMLAVDPLAAALDETLSGVTNDVGHLQRRLAQALRIALLA